MQKKRLDFSCSHRPRILIPHMGAGNMPDFDAIKSSLERLGAEVLNADLSDNSQILRDLPWDGIGVVDLSNMRGCLTSYDKYHGIIDRLHDFMMLEGFGDNDVSILPRPCDIRWIANKTNYLQYLTARDVPIIPTTYISATKDPDHATPITQPDNVDECVAQMFQFMDNSKKKRFVLKPSTSSLGRGLVFIERNGGDDNTFKVILPKEGQTSHETQYCGQETFIESFLMPYFLNTPSHDHRFLFQEYVKNLETSAVFVNGTPHFVERTQGPDSMIAHARYGGTDTVITNPDLALVEFVNKVMKSLPSDIQRSMFLRIDAMRNLETGEYILSEIEGAGAVRLWLREAGRVEDYARMLLHCYVEFPQPANDRSVDMIPGESLRVDLS